MVLALKTEEGLTARNATSSRSWKSERIEPWGLFDFSPVRFRNQTHVSYIACYLSAGDVRYMSLIPRSGRSPGGGHGNPLQYCCLENPTDGGAWWWAMVHGIAELDMTEATQHTAPRPLLDFWTQGC